MSGSHGALGRNHRNILNHLYIGDEGALSMEAIKMRYRVRKRIVLKL